MDGLDDFEKALAAEKLEREREEPRKHKHHHRHRRDDDGHRHKRSRRDKSPRNDDDDRPPATTLQRDGDDRPPATTLQRDSWMTTPAVFDVEYTRRSEKPREGPAPPAPDLKLHKNELNLHLHDEPPVAELQQPASHEVDYTFGDAGAQWRMTKLKAVRTQADKTGRSIDEVAIERFGSLREYDDAREEETELDRRKVYGKDYVGKEKPSGELYQQRKLDMGIRREATQEEVTDLPQAKLVKDTASASKAIDQTTLNRLKAQLMKARLKRSPDIAQLEAEYTIAAAAFQNPDAGTVVLSVMENRMLSGTRGEVKAIDNKRGRERGLVQDNEDMSIEDMVREERRTRGQAGGDGMRMAERIAKDVKFEADLDYMDDNASKLAKRVQKSELNLKNVAINDYQKMARILDSCQLCHQEDKNQPPIAPIMSLATRTYLTLPTMPELSDGSAVIVPIQHRTNLLECDDDEWEEIRNFMKCLTRMYHDQGRDVVFYENAAAPQRKMHAAMQVVPLPYSLGETAPAFFKEAILSADEEWSQHKKLIDTASRAKNGLGRTAFRKSIAKEMPYFHAWFNLDGGLGHVVEDSHRWPRGDLFAREIIGGMLDVDAEIIKRQGRWSRADGRIEGFKKRWRQYDWTRVLTEGDVS